MLLKPIRRRSANILSIEKSLHCLSLLSSRWNMLSASDITDCCISIYANLFRSFHCRSQLNRLLLSLVVTFQPHSLAASVTAHRLKPGQKDYLDLANTAAPRGKERPKALGKQLAWLFPKVEKGHVWPVKLIIGYLVFWICTRVEVYKGFKQGNNFLAGLVVIFIFGQS